MDCLQTTWSVATYWKTFEYFMEQTINYTSNTFINGNLNVDLLCENNNKLSEIISEFSFVNVSSHPPNQPSHQICQSF
jgi:tryptophan synthase alpha subunit